MLDLSYKKGHDVPEGMYEVKLLDIKCHNKNTYKMQIEILKRGSLPWTDATKVITGYARRYGTDYADLDDCFGGGLLNKSTAYVGRVGIIDLSHSGWITLMPKRMFESSGSKE